jgi:hypothetical protein
MDTLIAYPDGTRQPGVSFSTANGFVARVVSAVAEDNIPDAERVCKILNDHFAEKESGFSSLPSGKASDRSGLHVCRELVNAGDEASSRMGDPTDQTRGRALVAYDNALVRLANSGP